MERDCLKSLVGNVLSIKNISIASGSQPWLHDNNSESLGVRSGHQYCFKCLSDYFKALPGLRLLS